MTKPLHRTAEAGFSMLELMIAVAVVGILVAIATVQFADMQRKSADASAIADLRTSMSVLVANRR